MRQLRNKTENCFSGTELTYCLYMYMWDGQKPSSGVLNFLDALGCLWQSSPGPHLYSIKIIHKQYSTLASPTPHEKFGHTSLFSLPDILLNSGYLEHPPLDLALQKHTSWKNQEACLTCVPLPWWHANTKDQHWFSVTPGRISPLQGLAACAGPRGSL